MFVFLALIAGVLNAVTVLQNGQLAAFYGDYSGSVMIHLVGLVAVLVIFACVRCKLPHRQKAAPWMFLGGVVGVGTVVFCTSAYGGVSVTAIGGLGLLGQSIASLIVDQYGLLGAKKVALRREKLVGVAAVFAGALTMVFPLTGANGLAALAALASGFTIVTARTMNARLAERHGAMRSTVMNYITGLGTSLVFMLIFGMKEPVFSGFQLSSNWFMYLGGALGVGLIMVLNVTVSKVSALSMTLLQFTGQIFTSLLLDTLLQNGFSWQSAIGGVLVAIGLSINTIAENRAEKKPLS